MPNPTTPIPTLDSPEMTCYVPCDTVPDARRAVAVFTYRIEVARVHLAQLGGLEAARLAYNSAPSPDQQQFTAAFEALSDAERGYREAVAYGYAR